MKNSRNLYKKKEHNSTVTNMKTDRRNGWYMCCVSSHFW